MADGQKSEAKKSSGAAKYKAAYKKSQLLIKKLKSKLEKLEESHEQQRDQIADLERRSSEGPALSVDTSELQAAYEASEAAREALEEQAELDQERLTSLEEALDAALEAAGESDELDELTGMLEESRQEVESLKSRLTSESSLVEDLSEQLMEAQNQLEALHEALEIESSAVAESTLAVAEKEALEVRVVELEGQLKESKELTADLEALLDEQETKIAKLEERLLETSAETVDPEVVDHLESELALKEGQLEVLESEMEGLKARLAELEEGPVEVVDSEELETLRSRVTELEDQLVDHEELVERLALAEDEVATLEALLAEAKAGEEARASEVEALEQLMGDAPAGRSWTNFAAAWKNSKRASGSLVWKPKSLLRSLNLRTPSSKRVNERRNSKSTS